MKYIILINNKLAKERTIDSYKISNYNINKDYEIASLNTRFFS